MAGEDLIAQFQALGMSEQKAKETLKNANVTKNLQLALAAAGSAPLSDGVGMLIYHMATKLKPQTAEQLPLLVRYIVDRKLDNTQRVDAALEYVLKCGQTLKANIDAQELEKECGVGVVVTPEQIERTVQAKIKASYKDALLEQRYHFNSFKILQDVRGELKWADAKSVKAAIDVEIFDLLGPKTEADLKPPTKQNEKPKAAKPKPEAAAAAEATSDGATTIAELMKTKVNFHAPGENFRADGYVVTEQTERLLKEHLARTGGKVHTRFPPEPNGILHIGHAKAININFGYAAAHDGVCYLRYDDTNPEKEEEKFFLAIKEMVEWLGYKPFKVTYSSDNFQQLYEWAVVLINKGLAYVCHQKAEELKGFNPKPSPWRERPIEESLRLFEDMKRGKIDEGAATLRMKVTLEEGKMDPVAYRIKFISHHRTGSDWCIYPTYDYTHCLCDSIEDITHSLCTKEFQSRRSSYYWLCNALDIYCPVQWEYGRLNMNYALVSKRKIAKLITEQIVHDWDDPRLFTLTALRRRGFPAEAINNFCAQMGVTGAQIAVDPAMLEAAVRDVLNITAPRRLVVLEPLKVTIKNLPHAKPVQLEVPDFPQNPQQGSHKITLDKVIYIEQGDFKLEPEKGYRRLSPNQSVGLRHAGLVISVVEIVKDPATGKVVELICTSQSAEQAEKPKAFVQWVSQPIQLEVRLYEQLFKHKNPEDPNEVPGGFLSDISEQSISVAVAFADKALSQSKVYDKFQFERIGFFSVDPDTTADHIVFNRTVGLKEDAGKK
ncbi:probable glutamine--tRNA ligase [Drosophila rhopaloa]|uniref:Probable glutamine--tRNA ligase n=1 Tax=Drosophila rhopaloa TaxID=1041015 RepID=A0A6P4EZJ6_DRORH|nr:probable glutamine--tRNA ligase [Drosophila rhopaloa]